MYICIYVYMYICIYVYMYNELVRGNTNNAFSVAIFLTFAFNKHV